MTVIEIIKKHLLEIGADGLCLPEGGCGCRVDDLAPCGDISRCQAAKYDPNAIQGRGWFFPIEEVNGKMIFCNEQHDDYEFIGNTGPIRWEKVNK